MTIACKSDSNTGQIRAIVLSGSARFAARRPHPQAVPIELPCHGRTNDRPQSDTESGHTLAPNGGRGKSNQTMTLVNTATVICAEWPWTLPRGLSEPAPPHTR